MIPHTKNILVLIRRKVEFRVVNKVQQRLKHAVFCIRDDNAPGSWILKK